jgi:hypothetical protein
MNGLSRLFFTIVLVGFVPLMGGNTPYSGRVLGSYERLYLPGHEAMGLVRVGALFDLNDYWAFGPEIYGAVTGRRGGFFTVGMEVQAHVPLWKRLGLEAGLYVGAGGGGSAPQGGGLMIRPSLGLTCDLGFAALEGGISRVWYPNGSIDSTQLHVGVSVPFGGQYWPGHDWKHHAEASTAEALTITSHALYEHYLPVAGAHHAHSSIPTTSYSLAGIEFVVGSDAWYGYLQAAGAGAGSATGYMELFGGSGYRLKIGPYFSLGIQGAIGAAGGGKVDTGGGLMYRADAVTNLSLFDHLKLGVRTGKVGAFGGSFSATSYGASLGYSEAFYGLGDRDFSGDANLSAWRFRVLHKSYMAAEGLFNDGQKNRIDLIGISLNRFLTPNCYLIGESYWAWQGQAGGYAEGIFGLGYESDAWHGLRWYAEVSGGVGGGGDVHMDGGLFGSLGGGIRYDLTPTTQISLGAAYVRSKTGGFRTQSITAGVSYNFSLFTR